MGGGGSAADPRRVIESSWWPRRGSSVTHSRTHTRTCHSVVGELRSLWTEGPGSARYPVLSLWTSRDAVLQSRQLAL